MTDRASKPSSKSSRVELLDRLAWDFAEYDSSDSYARIHWYPATFVPQLPRVLIEALSTPGQTVLDPFCGSGTTAAEAARLGRNTVAADINPVALLITSARVELARADSAFTSELREAYKIAVEGARSARDDLFREGSTAGGDHPAIGELARWYHEDTLRELGGLFGAIRGLENSAARTVLTAVASSVTRALSSQTKSWGHIADNVRPKEFVYKVAEHYFTRAFDAMTKSLDILNPRLMNSNGGSMIVAADARRLPLLSSSVDLVVTSYPYPEMTDYVLAQRLSLLWLSLDPPAESRFEIGARRRRFRSTSLQEFSADMETVFCEVARVVRPGAHVAIVGPVYEEDDVRSIAASAILDALCSHDLELVKEIERTVPSSRKRQSWGTLTRERVTVFRRDEGTNG